jgi:hypothetical protein
VARRIRIDGLLAKEESIYGTDPTPVAGTDGVKVHERLWSTLAVNYEFPNERMDEATHQFFNDVADAVPRGPIVDFDIAWRIRGAGVAYSSVTPVRPEADPMLVGSALSRTHDDTASAELVDYTIGSAQNSYTLYAYSAENYLYKLVGCRSSVSWIMTAGVLGTLRFVGRGILKETPTEVATPQITYDTRVPPAAVSMGLQVAGSWNPAFTTAAFRQNATLETLQSGNAAEGIDEIAIADVNPIVELSARAVPLTTYDPYTVLSARTTQALAATLGATQYNKLVLTVTNSHLRPPITNSIHNNGFAAWDLTYRLRDVQLRFN